MEANLRLKHALLRLFMNSDYDITLHSHETSSPGNARDRFLDSIGLGEISAVPGVTESIKIENSAEDTVDEGVVLSSLPDDMELTVIESTSGQRTIFSPRGSSTERTGTVAISITPGERVPAVDAEPDAEPVSSIPHTSANLDENLTLECPECHGELVLQRRHLGIEGLCVWCHTPILAAESARDSTVRTFPLLSRVTKPFTAPVAALVEELTEVAEPVTESASPSPEIAAGAPTPTPGIVAEAPAEVAAPAPAAEESGVAAELKPEPASFSPEAFGFGPPTPAPTPVSMTSLPATIPGNNAPDFGSASKEEVSPFDLDTLHATSSFSRIALDADVPAAGLGETMTGAALPGTLETETQAQAQIPGFGAFLQAGAAGKATPLAESWSTPAEPAAADPQETAGFTAATPWGSPSEPDADATAPVSLAPAFSANGGNNEATAFLPTDFAFGFGMPAPAAPTASLMAEIPEAEPAAAPWATAFEATAPVTEAPAAEIVVSAPEDEFAAAFSPGGFGIPAAPSVLGSFTAPGQANPDFTTAPLTNDFASGFQTTGFGAASPDPEIALVVASTIEAAPAPLSTPVDGFAAAFSPAGFGALAPAPAEPVKESEPTPAAFGFSSYMDPSPALPTGQPIADTVETPGFTFHNSPVSKMLFGGDATEEKRSFAMPGHGFSTGSSSESEGKTPLFPEVPATGWGFSDPIGMSSPEGAPFALSSGPVSVPGAGMTEKTPFEDSPFSSLAEGPPVHAPRTPVSLFSEAISAMKSPASPPMPMAAPLETTPAPAMSEPYNAAIPMPPLTRTQESTFSSISNPIEASAPNVVPESLGSKPKPKVRKGFIVLMVVIVGFAAGAALASFVLPIDEYVQAARSLMEAKFNPGSTIEQFPTIPLTTGEGADSAAVVPAP